MADHETWAQGRPGRPEAGYVTARPLVSAADLALLLWRAKWLMLLVCVPIAMIGILIALQMPKTYESVSRLYVRAGDEIRIVSTLPDTSRDTMPDLEQIIQGELELLASPVIAERTLSRFPLARVYPGLERARAAALAKAQPGEVDAIEFEVFQKSVDLFQRNFSASAAPNTPVLTVAFSHEDPAAAAEILNAAMASYLNYRAELFGARPVDKLTSQRRKFELELLSSEDAIRQFLKTHGIGDFANERSTAQGLYSALSGELSGVRSRASAVDGQVVRIRAQLGATPAEQDLFVEDSSDQALLNLRLEREHLLSRYTEDSRPVQNLDRQIAQVEAYLASQDGPAGLTRTGPNPTYQALEAALNTVEAEAGALASQRRELTAQLAQIEARLAAFTQLEPEWNELLRNRDLLVSNVRNLAERAQQVGTIEGIAAEDGESVRVLEAARVPLRGSSLRAPVAVLSVLFAGFTALIAGLMQAYSRRGFSTARSLQRTLGLPVITAIPRYS